MMNTNPALGNQCHFSEHGAINFTLHPTNRFNENKVEGSKLTRDYWDYLNPILNKYEEIQKEFLTKSKRYLEDNFGEVLKGFVVLGVARERSVSTAEAAIKLDNYPWENLVELNDTEKIWEKYGIGNSGGMVFLIDENGIIVANDPSIEEIRDFLINKL